MGIHQLSVLHDERQDRLLLRVNTQEGEEFRFWLTRRMVARLLPAVEQAVGKLESQRSGVLAPDAPTRQMLTDMQREAFMQQADFKTPYAPPPGMRLPLGEQPLLVTDVQISVLPSKPCSWCCKTTAKARRGNASCTCQRPWCMACCT